MNKSTLLLTMILIAAALPVQSAIPEGYVLKWSDEFEYTGSPDPTKWVHQIGGGGWGNSELQYYTDSLENSRVEEGRLIIEARKNTVGALFTSARLRTREKAEWKYGRIEVLAKVPSETGTWSAIWMLASDTTHSTKTWPDNGEIDIMEHVGYKEDPLYQALVGVEDNIHGTLHTYMQNGSDNQGLGDATMVPDASTAFHTYAINWFEDRIEFEVDGQVYQNIVASEIMPGRVPPLYPWQYWPFDQRFHLLLNVAVGGNWGGVFNTNYFTSSPYPNGVDMDGIWPQRMEVEYVRIYELPELPEPTAVPGTIEALEMDDAYGILIETATNAEAPHNLHAIDAGDWADFVVEAPRAGIFDITTLLACPFSGRDISFSVSETDSSISAQSVPNTGSSFNWQLVSLGSLYLQQGLNTLRMETSNGGFELAQINLDVTTDIPWQSYLMNGYGDVETDSWMGRVNVNNSPWIYTDSMGSFIYSPAAQQQNFNTDAQWIFVPKY